MKILTIGIDEKILDKENKVYKRIKEYADLCEEYYCFVLTNAKNKNKFKKIIDKNFIVIPVFYKNKFSSIFDLINAFKKEKNKINNIKNKNDVVISSQDPFEIGLFVYLLSKLFKYNFHLQIHTDIGSEYFKKESLRNYIQFLISKFLIKKSKSIRVVSKRIKDYLIKNLNIQDENIFVAPIYVDVKNKNSKNFSSLKERENVILILCRIEKVKNISLAIESFQLLQKEDKYKDYILKIVGEGSQKKELQEKYKHVKNIIWESWSNDVERNFGEAKISLITSLYEGYGITAVESVSCYTPVVMTDVGCSNEFIFNNLNGQIVKSFDKEEVAEKIKIVLDNLDNYNFEKLQNSLNTLQTKEEYLETLKKSWKNSIK